MKPVYFFHKKCDVCSSKVKSIIFSLGNQKLVRCAVCHIIYFDRQRVDLKNLYNDNYYSLGKGEELYANYANYESKEEIFKKNFKFAYHHIAKSKKKNKKLLEIGAGFGYFPKYLPKDILYESVEVSVEAANKIRKKKYKVFNADFLDVRFKKKYDFIVGFDVIEHQIHLKAFFDKINNLLGSNGTFIFTTPDYGSIANRIFKKNAPTIQPLYHNYYFSKKWLCDNSRLFGFKIVSIRTVYFAYLDIGQIVLLGSFALPIFLKIYLSRYFQKSTIKYKVIPFIKFGGIECIMEKI